MSWGDVLVTKVPMESVMRRALAQVFGVPESSVGVFESATSSGFANDDVSVVVTPTNGEFGAMLTVYFSSRVPGHATKELEGLMHLCPMLGISAFVSDESDDPSRGYLVSAAGEVVRAELDLDAEDEGVYILKQCDEGNPTCRRTASHAEDLHQDAQ